MANIEYSERPIHFTRVLDLLIAAANKELNITTTENLAQKEFLQFSENLAKSEERFREIITKSTPALYLVDFKKIALTIKKAFSAGSNVETLRYTDVEGNEQTIEIDYKKDITSVILNEEVLAKTASSSSFEADLVEWLQNDFYGISNSNTKFRKTRAGTQNLVVQEFEKSIVGIVPTEKQASVEFLTKKSLKEVDKIVEHAYDTYTARIASLLSSNGTLPYSAYEEAAIIAGRYLTTELKKIGTFLEDDISQVVSQTSKKTHALVVSNTFNAAQENVNKILQPSVVNFLSSKITENIQDVIRLKYKGSNKDEKFFNIGNIINAGHTAAFVGNTALGVNMPSSQKVNCLVDFNTAQNLDKALSSLYFDLDYTVNFTQEYRSTISKYVGFQFAVVVTMPAALNTKGLNRAEQSIIKNFAGRITRKFNEVLSKKTALWVKEASTRSGPNTSASETLVQANLSELFSIFDPVKFKPVRFAKGNEADKSAKTPAKIKLNTKPIKLKTSSGPGGVIRAGGAKSKRVAIPPKKGTESIINLPMLMLQINNNLHDQIKRNMGDGSRKDVLNYGTGRFAQSAKVEKLSESRQGMITAFYSYMKNPYATFSRGGRQERPYTRDPKLLISKSIRELAGQQVANRMRAVLV